MQGVVQHRSGICVHEGPQVPVHVVGEHDGCGIIQGDGYKARCPACPGRFIGESVCCEVEEVTWEPLVRLVVEHEGQGVFLLIDHSPWQNGIESVLLIMMKTVIFILEISYVGVHWSPSISENDCSPVVVGLTILLVIPNETAMQCILPIMLVLRGMIRDAINGESAILDPIRISSHYSTKVRVDGLGVIDVLLPSVITQNDILRIAILIIHKEICESSSVRDEGGIYSRSTDGVLLERITREVWEHILRRDSSEGSNCEENRRDETHIWVIGSYAVFLGDLLRRKRKNLKVQLGDRTPFIGAMK